MERLGDEVRGSLRSAGVPDAGLLADVDRVWPAAVGPGIAAAAWPSRIGRDETLHVNTASSVWAFELTRLEDEIRGRLATALPDATLPPRIRFTAGPVPPPARRRASRRGRSRAVAGPGRAARRPTGWRPRSRTSGCVSWCAERPRRASLAPPDNRPF